MFKLFALVFSKIGTWFRIAMLKGKQFLKKEVPTAIKVVEMIKQFVESPATPLLVRLIPGEVDDVVAAQLKLWLPKILIQLNLVNDIASLQTNDEIVQAVINRLREIPKVDRKAKYLEIASKLSTFLIDGKLTWEEIVVLVQTAYAVQNSK